MRILAIIPEDMQLESTKNETLMNNEYANNTEKDYLVQVRPSGSCNFSDEKLAIYLLSSFSLQYTLQYKIAVTYD